MSKKNKKEKRVKEKNKNIYKNPVLQVKDNIVFTNKGVWAYYIISERPYDFLSQDGKIKLANSTIQSLASLCRRSDQSVDCHLLITNFPFDPLDWENQVVEHYDKQEMEQRKVAENSNVFATGSREPFERYVAETVRDLHQSNYQKRVTFLGIRLYTRGAFDFNANPFELGWGKAFEIWKSSLSQVLSIPDERISRNEENRAIGLEKTIFQVISKGGFQAKRPTAEEMMLTIKRRYYPSMPSPFLEVDHENRVGLADIAIETGGEIYVEPKRLKIVQNIDGREFTGYRATMTLSSLPRDLYIPSNVLPFFYRPSILPFTCSARFVLVPSEEMKKEQHKKKLETDDEISNLSSSGQGANTALVDSYSDLMTLEAELSREKQPWITGSYRITVEGDSPEFINEAFASLKQEFAEDGAVLTLTSGDQLDLFREEQLGGEIEVKSFQLTTNLALMAFAGINFGGTVGDPIFSKTYINYDSRNDNTDD